MSGNNPPVPDLPPSSQRLFFRANQRLSLARDYQRVYAARTSVVKGPLRFHAVPNTLGRTRLGLSIPKRVGTNVKRNRIKRLLRDAFRLNQHALPAGLDVIVGVNPHATQTLDAYATAMHAALQSLAATWKSRADKAP